MDAKAEAEKRYDPDKMHDPEMAMEAQDAFQSGAAWALREFGDVLDEAGAAAIKKNDITGALLMSFAADAHHIADGIEHGD